MDHLSAALKRGGIRDLLVFFPATKRDAKALEGHFKAANLPQVADWYAKKQSVANKDGLIKELQELCEKEEPAEHVRDPSTHPHTCQSLP